MRRDSLGVIEMDGLAVKLPLELDDVLLLALNVRVVEGVLDDVGDAVGDTETASIQSTESGPSQVTHEGWHSRHESDPSSYSPSVHASQVSTFNCGSGEEQDRHVVEDSEHVAQLESQGWHTLAPSSYVPSGHGFTHVSTANDNSPVHDKQSFASGPSQVSQVIVQS